MVIVIQIQVNLNLNVYNPSHANATIECNTSTTEISISTERQQPITRGMTSFQNVTFFSIRHGQAYSTGVTKCHLEYTKRKGNCYCRFY